MLLAKNCYKKDNILRRGTIRLGSLYEYRATEQEQIADSEEGLFSYKIVFDGEVLVSRKWLNAVFNPAIKLSVAGADNQPHHMLPGLFEIAVQNLNYRRLDITGDEFMVTDSSASISREAINGFMFCTSLIRRTSESEGIFPDYDDCWYLNASNADKIAEYMCSILFQKILTCRNEGNHLIPSEIDLSDLEVICQHGLVIYQDRHLVITKEADAPLNEFSERTRNLHFVKPPEFSHEKEYRFSFWIASGNKFVEPLKNSVILEAPLMAKIAFEL